MGLIAASFVRLTRQLANSGSYQLAQWRSILQLQEAICTGKRACEWMKHANPWLWRMTVQAQVFCIIQLWIGTCWRQLRNTADSRLTPLSRSHPKESHSQCKTFGPKSCAAGYEWQPSLRSLLVSGEASRLTE